MSFEASKAAVVIKAAAAISVPIARKGSHIFPLDALLIGMDWKSLSMSYIQTKKVTTKAKEKKNKDKKKNTASNFFVW